MIISNGTAMFLAIFAILGIVTNLLALIVHALVPKLMKNPGFLIFLNIFCQLIYMSHLFVVAVRKFT